MTNFNDIEYVRVDYNIVKDKMDILLTRLRDSNSYQEFLSVFKEIINIQNYIEEMFDIADIRNMRNQSDSFYIDEIKYWNKYKPMFDELFIPFYEIILNSMYLEDLKKIVPPNYFRIISYLAKGKTCDISPLIEKENELKTRYRNLNRSKINFMGESISISRLSSYFKDKDRSIRKKAHDALNDYYYSKRSEYDSILFELIKVRNEIAKRLGYDNYKEYSLVKQSRFGYDYDDIKKFRDSIIKYAVPLCDKLKDRQREELNVDSLMYYDTIFFRDTPSSIYSDFNLLDRFRFVFNNIDSELSNLYSNMLDNGYIDLLSNDDKVGFSITNYLVDSRTPAITGNFKGSYLDIKTLSHEMGHSYQKYLASIKDKEYIVPSILKYPPMAIAEMFSYAMELISLDYIRDLFGSVEDYSKYIFMEIYSLINNLPYICMVDEFQEIIYTKEDLEINDIRSIWKKLSYKYHLDICNSGHINLVSGGYFYRQSHIYLDPFYYIDYALSYFGAIVLANSDLSLYKEVGSIASYYSFTDLIDKYNFPNVFDSQVVKNTIKKLERRLK